MKKSHLFLLAVLLVMVAAVTPSLINNGKLQSDMNVNGFRLTNGITPSASSDL